MKKNLNSIFKLKDINGLGLSKNDFSDLLKADVESLTQLFYTELNLIPERYLSNDGITELQSSIRTYATVLNDGKDHYITTTVGGSAQKMLFFFRSDGSKISDWGGVGDGEIQSVQDFKVNFPADCAYYKVTGLTNYGGITLKRRMHICTFLNDLLKSQVQLAGIERFGYYVNSSGTLMPDIFANGTPKTKYTLFPISNVSDEIYINTTIGGSARFGVVYINQNGNVVGTQFQGADGGQQILINQKLTIPANAKQFYLVCDNTKTYSAYKVSLASKVLTSADLKAIVDRFNTVEKGTIKTHSGKTTLHFDTSIGEGGLYPTEGPKALGGTGINMSLGSSTIRISRADGTYNGLAWENYMYALADTFAEKATKIANWDVLKTQLGNNPPTTLSDAEKTKITNSSWEYRLLPYLNGTYPMPDAFCIGHGRNDGYSNDLTTIPVQRNDRRYYIGAMNYIVDIILSYNKYAKIWLWGHYENDTLPQVSQAQMIFADIWGFPICKTWEMTGWSAQKVPNTAALWNQLPWSSYKAAAQAKGVDTNADMDVQQVWIPDRIHTFTDPTGKASQKLVNIYINFAKDVFV